MEKPTKLSREAQAVGLWFAKERDNRDLDQKEVADMLETPVGPVTISSMETRGVSYKLATKRAEELGWEIPPLSEILETFGPAVDERDGDGDELTLTLTSLQPSAGNGAVMEWEQLEHIPVSRAVLSLQYPEIRHLENLALCTPRGDSMETTLPAKATLLVDRSQTDMHTSGIYVLSYEGALMVKRLSVFGATVDIISDNSKYPLRTVACSSVTVLAKVIGIHEGFKIVS